jgi:hypothetical protein
MFANVAKSEEKNPLVLVEFVITASVAARFVVVALILSKLVVKKFVEVPLVITEDEAKIF